MSTGQRVQYASGMATVHSYVNPNTDFRPSDGSAVVWGLPLNMNKAHQSECGKKLFIVRAEVEFDAKESDDEPEVIYCTSVAMVWVDNDPPSPFHFHQSMLEHYTVVEGEGYLVVDEGPLARLIPLIPGVSVTLPPGVKHGAIARPGTVMSVRIDFNPPIADRGDPRRDEIIEHPNILEYVRETHPTWVIV